MNLKNLWTARVTTIIREDEMLGTEVYRFEVKTYHLFYLLSFAIAIAVLCW